MCNSKSSKERDITSSNEVHQEDIDKLFTSVNGVKESLASISSSLVSLTSDRVSELSEKTKDYSFDWLFDNDENKDPRRMGSSMFPPGADAFPRPYQDRGKDDLERSWGYISWGPESKDNGSWGDFFGRGRSPFGYSHYKNPSIRSYNECQTKNGESVWDSKGYWRCLFPKSEIPIGLLKHREHYGDKILTKEDFESAVDKKYSSKPENGVYDLGEQGVFFKQFEDLMNWKTIMYQNAKRDRRSRREEFRKSWGKPQVEAPEVSGKQVVSTSVQSTYNSDSESKQEELKEIRTDYFSDGTSVTKEITKAKPLNASDWVTVVENVDNGSSNGWFWKSGKN